MSQIIGDEQKVLIRITLDIAIRNIISVVGVITNVFNMIIFSSLGLKDSMSVGLFSLSFTDFLVTGFQFVSGVCFTIDLLYPTSPIDSWSLGYFVFGFIINGTYIMSCWITVVISVERCFCVVSPFTVKQIFTRDRCVTSVVIIYAVVILLHVIIYATHRMGWKNITQITDKENSTIYVFTVIFNQETAYFELIYDVTVGISVLFLAQTIVIVCAVWMGYSLEASSRVRQSTRISNTTGKRGHSTSSNYLTSASSLSRSEKRLIKVVLFLGVILTISNIPRIVTAIVYHTVPGMDTGSQENLSTTLWASTSAIGSMGCSATFFVYIVLNTNYRRSFNQMCKLPC